MPRPTLFVVAGPNGNGKSTLTRTRGFRGIDVIDPDAIAKEMGSGTTEGMEIAAGREALHRRRAAIDAGRTLAVETTLSGTDILRLMDGAREVGYRIALHYVCVGSQEQSLQRIQSRVMQGGHDIPEKDVRRRFVRSLDTLPSAIARSDEAYLYDNRFLDEPHLEVAILRADMRWIADNCPGWAATVVQRMESSDRKMN